MDLSTLQLKNCQLGTSMISNVKGKRRFPCPLSFSAIEPFNSTRFHIFQNFFDSCCFVFLLFPWVNKGLVTRHLFAVSGSYSRHRRLSLGKTCRSLNRQNGASPVSSHSPQFERTGRKTKPHMSIFVQAASCKWQPKIDPLWPSKIDPPIVRKNVPISSLAIPHKWFLLLL